jgi:hypothetical protein
MADTVGNIDARMAARNFTEGTLRLELGTTKNDE